MGVDSRRWRTSKPQPAGCPGAYGGRVLSAQADFGCEQISTTPTRPRWPETGEANPQSSRLPVGCEARQKTTDFKTVVTDSAMSCLTRFGGVDVKQTLVNSTLRLVFSFVAGNERGGPGGEFLESAFADGCHAQRMRTEEFGARRGGWCSIGSPRRVSHRRRQWFHRGRGRQAGAGRRGSGVCRVG